MPDENYDWEAVHEKLRKGIKKIEVPDTINLEALRSPQRKIPQDQAK